MVASMLCVFFFFPIDSFSVLILDVLYDCFSTSETHDSEHRQAKVKKKKKVAHIGPIEEDLSDPLVQKRKTRDSECFHREYCRTHLF